MKLFPLPLIAALALPLSLPPLPRPAPHAASNVVGKAPDCVASLTLPDSALVLRCRFRQLGPDLAPFTVPSGLDDKGVRQHEVMSLLAQASALTFDVSMRAGEHAWRPGSYSFGFTIDAGGAPRFFMVDGHEAFPLPSSELPVEWASTGLLMQWQYVDRSRVRLIWKLKDRAGAIEFRLGAPADSRSLPSDVGEGAGDGKAATPEPGGAPAPASGESPKPVTPAPATGTPPAPGGDGAAPVPPR